MTKSYYTIPLPGNNNIIMLLTFILSYSHFHHACLAGICKSSRFPVTLTTSSSCLATLEPCLFE